MEHFNIVFLTNKKCRSWKTSALFRVRWVWRQKNDGKLPLSILPFGKRGSVCHIPRCVALMSSYVILCLHHIRRHRLLRYRPVFPKWLPRLYVGSQTYMLFLRYTNHARILSVATGCRNWRLNPCPCGWKWATPNSSESEGHVPIEIGQPPV